LTPLHLPDILICDFSDATLDIYAQLLFEANGRASM